FGMLLQREAGGASYAAVVFEQLGAHLAPGPLLWSTIAAALVPDAADGAVRVAGVDVTTSRPPYVVEHAGESDVVVVLRDHGVTSCVAAELPESESGEPL